MALDSKKELDPENIIISTTSTSITGNSDNNVEKVPTVDSIVKADADADVDVTHIDTSAERSLKLKLDFRYDTI